MLRLLPTMLLTGCLAHVVDKHTVKRVLERGMPVADVGKVCAVGEGLAHPLASLAPARRPPTKALIIAEAASALCEEPGAWEAELLRARLQHNQGVLGEGLPAELTDALESERRAHAMAAGRFYRAWKLTEAEFGPIGEGCPRLGQRDEIVYLLGLFAGLEAVLHDKSSGVRVGVPVDILPKVARATECLDDQEWWFVPAAFRTGIWATIPGSGPEGVDAWAALEDAARAGEASGVRLARGVAVLLAGNGGRTDVVEAGLASHAASVGQTPIDPDWALLDEYARSVSLHQSDLLWTQATGHRTVAFGQVPSAAAPADGHGDDPFGSDDPFGEDPFSAPGEEPPPGAVEPAAPREEPTP